MSIRILLIDDDEIDAEFMRRMLENAMVELEFFHVRDGVEGLQFLRGEDAFAAAPSPDLVVLDLHMPRMDGRTFLEELRADDSLQRTPVAVLLASQERDETIESYGLKVDAYLVKPVQHDELMQVMRRLNVIQP